MAKLTADTLTDEQIRELQASLFSGPADDRQLSGLVACHDAVGRSYRRSSARARCAEILNDRESTRVELRPDTAPSR